MNNKIYIYPFINYDFEFPFIGFLWVITPFFLFLLFFLGFFLLFVLLVQSTVVLFFHLIVLFFIVIVHEKLVCSFMIDTTVVRKFVDWRWEKTERSSWNRNQKQNILSEKNIFNKRNKIKNKYINYKSIMKIYIL